MKQLISHQLVKYLEDRGVEYLFGLCGHTNIAVLAALQGLEDQVRQHAPRADRGAHRRRLRARQAHDRGRPVAPRPGADERVDRRRQRGARLDPDGRDRRRHPEPLLRQAPAPGSQPARRRVAVGDLPAVRQARLARRASRPLPRDHREGVPARRERPARARCWSRCRWTSSRWRSTPRSSSASSAHTRALHKPSMDEPTGEKIVRALLEAKSPLIYAGGGVILADAADELREFATHLAIPVAHTLMGKGVLPDDHPLTLGMTGFWGTKFVNDKCLSADWIIGLGTRFAEADCSSWDTEFTFSMPPTQADPHRHRLERDRPQLPGRDRRRHRPEGSARRPQPRRQEAAAEGPHERQAHQGDRRATAPTSSPATAST